MKLGFTLNQIAVVACILVGSVAMSAMLMRYPGLIEMQCGTEGCRIVIDGRS
jgi:hypothetical protein